MPSAGHQACEACQLHAGTSDKQLHFVLLHDLHNPLLFVLLSVGMHEVTVLLLVVLQEMFMSVSTVLQEVIVTKPKVTTASVAAAIWHGIAPKTLTRFLVLGLPGGVMMAADACSFDVTTVMASILGMPCLSTLLPLMYSLNVPWYLAFLAIPDINTNDNSHQCGRAHWPFNSTAVCWVSATPDTDSFAMTTAVAMCCLSVAVVLYQRFASKPDCTSQTQLCQDAERSIFQPVCNF